MRRMSLDAVVMDDSYSMNIKVPSSTFKISV